jgi:multidrug efflux pump subunit AcrA (membrane-fusion protein)
MPTQQSAYVQLPAGLPLARIIVAPGDKVRAGQTLAILDITAMHSKLMQVKRDIIAAGVLRDCLLNTDVNLRPQNNVFDSPANDPPAGPELAEQEDAETHVLVLTAIADCKTQSQAERVQLQRVSRALAVLTSRFTLLEQKLSMILSVNGGPQQRKTVHPVARAHASVSIALEKNLVLEKIQTIKSEYEALKVDHSRRRLDRISNLSDIVAKNLMHQAVLAHYLKTPRLQAPEDATVSRIRPILAGTEYTIDENLLELRPTGAEQYHAELRIPADQSHNFRPGGVVEVTLAGFTDQGPILLGEIARLVRGDSSAHGESVTAVIALSEESQKILADPANGIALRGQSTASVIKAHMPPKLFSTVLEETFAQTVRRVWGISLVDS